MRRCAAILAAGTPYAADAGAHYAKPKRRAAFGTGFGGFGAARTIGCRNETKRRKTPRAVTALTVDSFRHFRLRGQTVDNRCNHYGNIVNSDNQIVVNVGSSITH
jgi:hypothetical protein